MKYTEYVYLHNPQSILQTYNTYTFHISANKRLDSSPAADYNTGRKVH